MNATRVVKYVEVVACADNSQLYKVHIEYADGQAIGLYRPIPLQDAVAWLLTEVSREEYANERA